MHRRAFILVTTGGLLAVPLAAEGQHQGGKVYRVGTLFTASREDAAPRIAALELGLASLGATSRDITSFSCIGTPMIN